VLQDSVKRLRHAHDEGVLVSRKRKRRRSGQPGQREGKKAYPSPAERARIIERRDRLWLELTEILVVPQKDNRAMNGLILRYGLPEVRLVLEAFQEMASSTELIGNEASIYRAYRRAFARFGGDRPFLSAQEYSDLSVEHARLKAKRTLASAVPPRPGAREREVRDLLVVDGMTWDDITPPAVPSRPDDFAAPPPGDYDYPVRALLDWGWIVDEQRLVSNARNVARWRRAVPGLVRMVLDEGLLNGWPGEPSSWAPYHALHMLGQIGAHEAAGQMFPLFDLENDWLSDRLATVWGQMGPRAEPPLWDHAGDDRHDSEERAVVFLGLAFIAKNYPERRGAIVDGLAQLLQAASAGDAEANAYVVHVLATRLEAVEAAGVIARAFEQNKVDESIMAPYDVHFLD
jgi:hypothetical protein